MNRLDYWSTSTNPTMGRKFESELSYLRVAHNGNADIDAYIDSAYGERHAQMLELGYRFEEDPTGEAVKKYYHSLGLERHMMENGDYYTRWLLITPEEMEDEAAKGHRYPLVFVNHGGFCSISADEFVCGMPHVAAEERIIVVIAQNTNWTNTQRILDRMVELYPVDPERVYMIGESQGGYQVTSTYFRIPERFAAVSCYGNDIYRDYDNFNVPYTPEETQNLTRTFLPFMQVVGQYEASGFAPVNDWHPRKDWGKERDTEPYRDPRRDDSRDPTHIVGGRRRFSDMPVPPEGVDKHQWMIERLNKRLATLNCDPRDADTCIGYLEHPDSELHQVIGFYGDDERTELHYGAKHWMLDIHNRSGIDALRYVVVENAPHCWPVAAAELSWQFFRQFRRDIATGRIVMDPYQPANN